MAKKFDAKMLEALIPAVMNAVIVTLDAMSPEEEQEARLENYVPKEAVKSVKGFDDYPDFLTVSEAAAMLCVRYATAYQLARSKNTPFVAVTKTKRMVNKHDLIKYYEERRGGYLLDKHNGGDADE